MTYAFLNVRLHVLPSLKLNIVDPSTPLPPALHPWPAPPRPVEGWPHAAEEAQQIYVNMLCVAPSGV